MGKRRRENEEDRIRRKIRKLEKKLETHAGTRESTPAPPPTQTPPAPPPPQTPPVPPPSAPVEEVIDPSGQDENIPEDLLLALGDEGILSEETGEPIHPQLVERWSRLMAEGLGAKIKDIIKKYPKPLNFAPIAPELNPEILVGLAEAAVKRDRRILSRQNLTGKLLTALGGVITNLMRGVFNNKDMIEKINDAAKMATEIFFQDSSSRRFLALGGAAPAVREAAKGAKADTLLFGSNFKEKIKIAQENQKLNWKSPLPQQTRSGQPRRPLQQARASQPRGGQPRRPLRTQPTTSWRPPQPNRKPAPATATTYNRQHRPRR